MATPVPAYRGAAPDLGVAGLEQDGPLLLRPGVWHLGGGGAITLPRLGPPEMPTLLVTQVMEQLSPAAVVSSATHRLLPCPAFGRLGCAAGLLIQMALLTWLPRSER